MSDLSWREAVEDPGVLGALLRLVLEAEERDSRPRWAGQRPRGLDEVGDVLGFVGPVFSDEPFGVAVRPLLKPSMGAVAQRAGLSKQLLHSMIRGRSPLTVERLEAVARAVRVNPGYFVEYREARLGEFLLDRLRSVPDVQKRLYLLAVK